MNPRDSVQEAPAVERPLEQADPGDADDGKALSFDCNVCSRSFPFQSSLSQHMRRHTGARPYKCPYCEHRASQKGNLKVHIRSHKLGVLIKANPDDSEDVDESEEGSVSEGLDGGNTPTKSGSACNGMLNGAVDERGTKVASRGVKRERSVDASKMLRCRLCGHEVQREDQLLSHIEKAHITADVEDEGSPTGTQEAPMEPEAVEEFTCDTCGQVFAQASLLKAHMKKHTGELEHRCKICGRGFREAWFLKSHMKTHNGTKSSGRGRPRSVDYADPPATINDVVQDPEAMSATGGVCQYEICSKCGNLFHDRESLRTHSRVHSKQARNHSVSSNDTTDKEDSPAAKRRLTEYLGLRTVEDRPREDKMATLGKRVSELDPVCSYQAWQLANRGRVAEPVDFGRDRDDSLAAATVTYDRESSRYVLAGQEKKPSRRGSYGGTGLGGGQSSPGERSTHDESPSDSEYLPSSRQERRRSSQSRSHECFECGKVFRSRHQLGVHERSHRRDGRGSGADADSRSPSRPGTPQSDSRSETPTTKQGAITVTEEKPYICSLCDFITPDSSTFISHLRMVHPEPSLAQEPPSAKSTTTTTTTTSQHPSSSRGGSYPKLKRALLQGSPPSRSPSLSRTPPEHLLAPNTVVAVHSRPLTPAPADSEPAVDLCVRPEGASTGDPVAEDLPSHRCSYCAHRTRYPEVLWMHQMIAHRLNSSALVPRWAQKSGGKKSSELRRRTGPPPALDGKECPPLPINVRSSRTRPPASSSTATPSNGSSHKRDRPSSSSSSSSSVSSSSPSAQPRPGSSAPRSSKVARVTHTPVSRTRAEPEPQPQRQQESRSRPRVNLYPRVTSDKVLEKSAGATHSSSNSTGRGGGGSGGGGGNTSTTSPRPGARMADRYLLPQEGLGYMLSSKHGLSEYGRPRGSPLPSPSHQSTKPKPKPKPNPKPTHTTHSQPAHTSIASSSIANHLYGASNPHGGAALLGLGSPALLRSGEAKQETLAAAAAAAAAAGGTPDAQLDILSFLKNCNSYELATLYHRWGMTNPLLEHTGLLRSLARQGEYACQECGKSFSQPSHLRTHMRSHTGERPFRCHLCPYRASQKGNLKTHVQSVHHMPFDNALHPDATLAKLERSTDEVHTPAGRSPPSH